MRTTSLFALFMFTLAALTAQTLYVPSGSSGIGSSPNGNVGIGTANPTFNLDVLNGQMRGVYLWAGGAGTSYDGRIYVTNSAGATKVYFGGASGEASFINTGGNVGIGTVGPSTLLQVQGTITAGASGGSTQGIDYLYGYYSGNGKLFTLGSQYSSGASFIGFGVKAKPGATGYLSSTDVAIGRTAFEANNGYLAFWSGASQTSTDGGVVTMAERMRIDSTGNVGIGTTSPTHKLAVNGTIRAKEVIVDTGWSDYVFKPDYKLASLSEVEGAIQRDGHLPGIPSAQEVAEHGVSMGEMQSKLLAKIEELTLHQIAQEKRLNEQTALLNEQATQLSTQSTRLHRLEQENATLRRTR